MTVTWNGFNRLQIPPGLKDASPNDPATHFALATTDVRDAAEQVQQAGTKITLELLDVMQLLLFLRALVVK